MKLTAQNYLGYILSQVPEFESLYQAHILLYEERLDYPLWADIFRYSKHLFDTHQESDLAEIIAFLNAVADSHDEELLDMFHTSFIEYLPHTEMSSPEFEIFILAHLNQSALQMYQMLSN